MHTEVQDIRASLAQGDAAQAHQSARSLLCCASGRRATVHRLAALAALEMGASSDALDQLHLAARAETSPGTRMPILLAGLQLADGSWSSAEASLRALLGEPRVRRDYRLCAGVSLALSWALFRLRRPLESEAAARAAGLGGAGLLVYLRGRVSVCPPLAGAELLVESAHMDRPFRDFLRQARVDEASALYRGADGAPGSMQRAWRDSVLASLRLPKLEVRHGQ